MKNIQIVNKLKALGGVLLAMVFGTFIMSSCTYDTKEFIPVEIPESVSFSTDVVPIFEAKCNNSGCHSGAIPPDLQADVAYNNLIFGGYVTDTTAAENNSFYKKIDGGSMTSYASDQDRALIKIWIEDGAQEN